MKATVYPVLLAEMDGCDYSHNVYGTNFGEKVKAAMLGFIVLDGATTAVFDTGPDMDIWSRKGCGIEGCPKTAFALALQKAGRCFADVTHVVLSHLHSDHIGNWELFPNARIVINRKEMAYAAAPINALYYEMDEVAKLVRAGDRLQYLDSEERLSSHMEAVFLGGHTPGSMGLYVETAHGLVMLAGDFVCVYENMRTRSVTVTDVDAWILALNAVKKRADIVLPGHEPRVMHDYPVL